MVGGGGLDHDRQATRAPVGALSLSHAGVRGVW